MWNTSYFLFVTGVQDYGVEDDPNQLVGVNELLRVTELIIDYFDTTYISINI